MSQDERSYLEERAERELALAQAATDSRVVQAHYQLATLYLDQIHGEEPQADGNLFC